MLILFKLNTSNDSVVPYEYCIDLNEPKPLRLFILVDCKVGIKNIDIDLVIDANNIPFEEYTAKMKEIDEITEKLHLKEL